MSAENAISASSQSYQGVDVASVLRIGKTMKMSGNSVAARM